MRGVYRVLHEENTVPNTSAPTAAEPQHVLTEAEKELLRLLKAHGVASICESISKEICYVWAVTSGFRTLTNFGNFYFACAGQTFGYNPGFDFFASGGMQLALFALHKFIHNEAVLVPVLESIHVYTKLHVDGAVDFLAVQEATEILMKCVRFHDNKHNVIMATCQALGSLVMNDLVKESISSSALTLELLGLLKRYGSSLSICRATLVPLGFLVTDAQITETFVDGNGIALVMTALKSFTKDTEVVWQGIGILNALNAKVLDPRLIYAIYGFTGIPRLVEALAIHLDTEEIAVEGFQLLSRLAGLRETYRVVNQCKVLDLAYVALFAYSGPQHRHTRIEIKKTLHHFQKCTLYDPHELASREQASRRDVTLYALFVATLLLTSALSAFGTSSSALVTSLQRSVEQSVWTVQRRRSTSNERHARRTLRDVNRVDDVWEYLIGPLHASLFASTWYNGDAFAADVDCQLGVVGRSNVLLGGVQLRMLRVQNATCGGRDSTRRCYPPYDIALEARSPRDRADGVVERWAAPDDSFSRAKCFTGHLAKYPDTGYRVFLPRLAKTRAHDNDTACASLCQLTNLRDGKWIDGSSRALFVEFNVYNAAEDLHAAVTLLLEFSATGGVLTSTRITPVFMNRYGRLFLLSPQFYAELLLLAGLVWHAHKQVDKLLRYRLYYFTVPTHFVDFLIVVLWVAALVMRLGFHATGSHALLTALAADNAFVNLNEIAFLLRQELELTAWCALLMWWRLLRLARGLTPLERTLEKFARAEDLVESYVALLVVYALVFAQTGFFLFPTSSESFSTFGKSIASTAKALVREWNASGHGEQVPVWGVLFRLCSVFVTLNIVVAILRERFETGGTTDKSPVEVPDGLSIVDLATRQLKASGMATSQASLPQRLREAASHGLERLHDAARHAFAISDDALELTELKKVWGLRSEDADADRHQSEQRGVGFATLGALLENAEDEERMLDERLSMLRSRSEEALRCLEIVQRLREERKQARLARSNRLRGIRTSASNASNR